MRLGATGLDATRRICPRRYRPSTSLNDYQNRLSFPFPANRWAPAHRLNPRSATIRSKVGFGWIHSDLTGFTLIFWPYRLRPSDFKSPVRTWGKINWQRRTFFYRNLPQFGAIHRPTIQHFNAPAPSTLLTHTHPTAPPRGPCQRTMDGTLHPNTW